MQAHNVRALLLVAVTTGAMVGCANVGPTHTEDPDGGVSSAEEALRFAAPSGDTCREGYAVCMDDASSAHRECVVDAGYRCDDARDDHRVRCREALDTCTSGQVACENAEITCRRRRSRSCSGLRQSCDRTVVYQPSSGYQKLDSGRYRERLLWRTTGPRAGGWRALHHIHWCDGLMVMDAQRLIPRTDSLRTDHLRTDPE